MRVIRARSRAGSSRPTPPRRPDQGRHGEVRRHQQPDTNLYNDATVAYRNACLNAVEYLKTFGYSGEQASLLLGEGPRRADRGRCAVSS
ncbi:acetamidase/formamidase family protein [Spirillospora sp. CA-108201]